MEYLKIEEIIIPSGVEMTIEDVINRDYYENVIVDENNLLIRGIETYLMAIKESKSSLSITRKSKLHKINVALPLAA